jgi:hypothetical protein
VISYRKLAAVAAIACAVAVPTMGSAHAATSDNGSGRFNGSGQSDEINMNLIKSPPGGILAPVADAVSTGKGLLSAG